MAGPARRLRGEVTKPAKKRRLAPIIWFSTPLAAAAALTIAYLGFRPSDTEPVSPPAGSAEASTMAYVDKESGWLVVWASDTEAKTKG